MQEILVSMQKIQKSFPGVHALDDAQLELLKGEVHALLGENGAGKSTLVKILTGVYQKDSGYIALKGEEVQIKDPRSAQRLGVGIVHQEFNLMPHLTVAQNIFIGREPRKNGLLDDAELNRKTQELLDYMNLNLSPTQKVGKLTVARQQMVEIAKAISFEGTEVLIMDEPTAALTDSEIEELFSIIKDLQSKGVGIVYISHRLEELKVIADRITVMRDGKYINTVHMADVTIDDIVAMMVGRELDTSFNKKHSVETDVVLKVENLNAGKQVQNVSFELKRGEILGFAGLMGAGRTEVARAIFGADAKSSGTIHVYGKEVDIKTPKDAVESGIAYLSEDRKRFGVSINMDVESNIVLANMKKFTGALSILEKPKIEQEAQRFIKELNIKTPSSKQLVKNLSGGNQQKVIIGKWLSRDNKILIFDEPTRGIDVGAKSEIYRLLEELAEGGTSIIMISSELPEVLRLSNRIIVMCEGRITGELSASEASQELIMKYATNREQKKAMEA